MLQKLSDTLLPYPFKIQAAVNRQWEKAWKMDPKNIIVSDDEIKKFCGTAEIAAIELFYKTKENTDFYLGLQFNRGLKNTPTTYNFFNGYFSVLKTIADLSLINIVKLLGARLDNNENLIQLKEPTSIAIGVVDYWMTYGPCTIWTEGENKIMNESIIKQKMVGHENLSQNKDNHVGLEFIYEKIPKYWFSFQVSENKQGVYSFEPSEVESLTSTYLSFSK